MAEETTGRRPRAPGLPPARPRRAVRDRGRRVVLVHDRRRANGAALGWRRAPGADGPAARIVDGLEAAEAMAAAGTADLVLVDSRLLGAQELARAVAWRRRHPDTPLAAVSLTPSAFEARFLLEAGLQGYLPHDLPPRRRDAAIALMIEGDVYFPASLVGALVPDPSTCRSAAARPILLQRVLHPDGRVSFPYVSEAAREALGIEAAEAMQRPELLLSSVHPEERELMRGLARHSAERLEDYSVEHRCVAADGGVHWRRCHYRVRRREDGAVVWDGISVAISDEHRAPGLSPAPPAAPAAPRPLVTRLPIDAKDLEGFLDSVPACLFRSTFDALGRPRLVIVSQGVEEMVGVAAEQALACASALFDMIHPEDRERLLATILAAGDQEQLTDDEYRMVLPSGEVRWVRNVSRRRRLPSGDVLSDGLITDITARKELEAERRLAEERVGAVAANLPCLIFHRLIDADGRRSYPFLAFGPQMEAVFGMTVEEARADPERLLGLVHEDDRERLLAHMHRSASELVPFDVTYRSVTPSGQIRWLRAVAHHTPLPNGAVSAHGIALDITEQQELEQQLAAIMRNLPGVVFRRVFPKDGPWRYGFLSFGQRLQEALGLTPEQAMADPRLMVDRIHPDDREAHDSAIAESVRRLVPVDREFRIVAVDGAIRWKRMCAHFWRQPNGEVMADGLTLEITHQKEVEARLRLSEARFRAIADNLPGAVYRIVRREDGQGCLTYLSPAIEGLLGLPPDAFVGRPNTLHDRVVEDDQARRQAAWERALRDEVPVDLVYRARRAAGGVRWLRDLARVTRDPDGRVIADGIMLDVTDEKEAERRLHETERQLSTITSNLPVALFRWIIGPDGSERCAFVSPAITQLAGVSAEDVMANPSRLVAAIDPQDRAPRRDRWLHAAAQLEPLEDEFRMRHADGTLRWVRVVASMLPGLDGAVIADGVLVDVTQRRMIAEQLTRRNHELLTLCRISEIALKSPSLDKGLRQIVDEVATILEGCTIAVVLYDPAAQQMEVKASSVPLDIPARIPIEQAVSWDVVRTDRPVIERNVQAKRAARLASLRAMPYDAFLGLPIRVNARCIGSFNVLSATELDVDAPTMELLWSYADYVASFIASRGIEEAPPQGPGARTEDFEARFARLTPRQRDVLAAVAEGLTNKEIAARLHMRIATVKVHVRAVLKALGVGNRTQAALIVLHLDDGLSRGARRKRRRPRPRRPRHKDES